MLKKYQPLLLVLLAYIIIGVFYPTITADFVNLDDNVMVLSNDYIKSFSFDHLKKIFTAPYYKLYHPLVTVSFAFEYLFVKLDPFLYHIDNIALHIFNTLLVFFILKRLSKSFLISYLTALIFAIHPIHVEAVSWISSRKDTLYSFFFLLSILLYMKVDDGGKNCKKIFWISVGSFLLSCLSKPTAVTLPLFLMLIDFCTKKMAFKRFARYLPYIAISALFIYIAVHFHYSIEEKMIYTLFFKYVNFISAHFNIMFYGYKFLFPMNLSVLYPYFFGVHSMMPWYVLYSPFILYTTILFVFLSLEYTKKIFFGFFFFFFALLPSSGVMPTGVSPVADRYAYLAIIGLAYLAVELGYYLYKKSTYLKVAVVSFSVIIFGSWSYITYSRNIVWRDSINLMTEAINYAPESAGHAYLTRGIIYKGSDRIVEAEKDFNKSYEIGKDNVTIYFHLAHLKQMQKKYDEALKYYSKVPDNYYDYGIVVNNVGLILGEQGKDKQAIEYLKKQIEKMGTDNSFVEYLYSNLALLYFKEKNYDEALNYVKLACEKNPTNYVYYIQQMIIYNEKDDFANFENTALEGMEKTNDDVNIVNELASKYFMLGRYSDVERLLFKEQKLNSDNHMGFFLLGNIAAMNGNFKAALIYYTMAIETSKENAEYYFKRAAVYLILNDYEKAKLNAEIAEKKGQVIDEDFKEGMDLLKQQIVEHERRLIEEQRHADMFEAIKQARLNAKNIQEGIISADIAAVKYMEERKAEHENIILNAMKTAKEKETAGKINQENKISDDMKLAKEKEMAGKTAQEDKISGDMKIAKEKEVTGKQTLEEQISAEIQEMKKIAAEKEAKGQLAAEEQTASELIAIKNNEKRKIIAEEMTAQELTAIKNMEERKKIEEQNIAEKLNAIKEGELKKTEVADRVTRGVKTGKMRDAEQNKIFDEIKTIKNREENKKEQENKIFAWLNISKLIEATRKQIQEETVAKNIYDKKISSERAKAKELAGKKEQENIIYASINIFKNREATRKQIQEEAIALSLKMKKNLSQKELEAKKEHESKVFALLNLFKTKEKIRKQIEEENIMMRIRAIKNMEIRKDVQEGIIYGDIRANAVKDFDIIKCFDIDEENDEGFEKYDEDSVFNL